jgi:hypothetical protein
MMMPSGCVRLSSWKTVLEMKKAVIVVALALSFSLLSAAAQVFAQAQDDACFISKDQVKALLGSPDMTLIDMRFGRDWTDATLKIKGAVREDPMKPGMWIDKYPKDKVLVFY